MSDTALKMVRSLLATENSGGKIIIQKSDDAVFIRQVVAERVIERLLYSIAKALNYIRNDNPEYAQEILEDVLPVSDDAGIREMLRVAEGKV